MRNNRIVSSHRTEQRAQVVNRRYKRPIHPDVLKDRIVSRHRTKQRAQVVNRRYKRPTYIKRAPSNDAFKWWIMRRQNKK